MSRLLVLCLAICLSLMIVPDATAQLSTARLFGDGMVMQRGHAVPVWGEAPAGAEVLVGFHGVGSGRQELIATADAEGTWRIELPAMEAGGPYTMTIESGNESLRYSDIWIGDVWVGSGQSNMEWTVADSDNADAEIAAANDPLIRHFKVPQSWSYQPEDELAGGEWEAARPATVGDFTAVGYYFARELREHVGVPIGIINSSWGGSRLEPWMSAESLGMDESAVAMLQEEESEYGRRIIASLTRRLGELPTQDAGLVDGVAHWAAVDEDDTTWDVINVPGVWEEQGYDGMDGVAWYRTSFDLSEEEASFDLRLHLAMIDDADITYVNAHEVGRGMEYNRARIYDVPSSALVPGSNVLAVRVTDFQGGGGIYGSASDVYAETSDRRIDLAGEWRFKVGAVTMNLEGRKNAVPTLLYNKMIHPMLDFPIAGVIWYQGESNAYPGQDYEYRDLFKTMITDWRDKWNVGDFPFLWAQLANYMDADEQPAESNWAVLRESQTAALELPATGQAVITDIGDPNDIHPRNKQDVGRRLALAARKIHYGHDVVHSGPMYASHDTRDGRIVISFDHVGGGLEVRGNELGGFAIAGDDGRFVWANATIDGDTVVVWSDDISTPVAVRYAWGDNPDRANLYNAEGLPAASFRTDAP